MKKMMSYEEKREKVRADIERVSFEIGKLEAFIDSKKVKKENISSLLEELEKLKRKKMELVNLYNLVR